MTKIIYSALMAVLCCQPLSLSGVSQAIQDPSKDDPAILIKQIYKEVSSDGVTLVDWEKVRSFFIEEAIIILRTSREESTQFTVEEFIQDFKDFYMSPAVGDSGFKEEVLRLNSQAYGDAAYVGVVYESTILKSDRPPQKGIDLWLLTRKDNVWKVVGVSNEIIPSGEAIPARFEPAGQ